MVVFFISPTKKLLGNCKNYLNKIHIHEIHKISNTFKYDILITD